MPLENEYGALALEATLGSLKTVSDNILIAASAVQVAIEALNIKALTLDTDNIVGNVVVDNFPESQPVSGPVTDTQLRAADVKITLDGEQVAISNFPVTQPISGAVSVSNMVAQGLTDAELRATAIPVSGPLTDTQLRATALPVSGTVSVSNQLNQPLTDTQLRATALPVIVNNSNLAAEESIQELQAIEQRVKALNANIQRMSFDATSQLRVLVSSLPTLSTVTTVGTVTTCNTGFGDAGKPSAAILTAFQAFQLGVGANFSRS